MWPQKITLIFSQGLAFCIPKFLFETHKTYWQNIESLSSWHIGISNRLVIHSLWIQSHNNRVNGPNKCQNIKTHNVASNHSFSNYFIKCFYRFLIFFNWHVMMMALMYHSIIFIINRHVHIMNNITIISSLIN